MKLFFRLKELRLRLGLNQVDFAKSLNIANSSYQYYERGERVLPSNVLEEIITLYGVSADWLLTGNGEMFNNIEKRELPLMNSLTLDEEYVLEGFKSLSASDKVEVIEVIKLKELEKKNKLLIENFDKLPPKEQQMFLSNLETAVSKNKLLNNK